MAKFEDKGKNALTHTERATIAEKIACALDKELNDMSGGGKRREIPTILGVVQRIMDA